MAGERIMIVEAETFHAELLRRFLDGRGYEIVVAGPRASCEAVRAGGCDLIVVSERAAGGSGLPLLERFATAIPDVPVVFLAESADPAAVARAYDAGADVAVSKPVDLSLLFRQIRATLRRVAVSSSADGMVAAG